MVSPIIPTVVLLGATGVQLSPKVEPGIKIVVVSGAILMAALIGASNSQQQPAAPLAGVMRVT